MRKGHEGQWPAVGTLIEAQPNTCWFELEKQPVFLFIYLLFGFIVQIVFYYRLYKFVIIEWLWLSPQT